MTTQTLNSLSKASSAYLRSAMHQPIQWNEWGEEAFATAKRENKPILLDIGAVWCHWCHVMDRESYDDPEVAKIVNERFVAVKVDRDERPDIDSRYQVAVSAISGQGGWPLTAFLTPDGKPFYGGTYFPPDDNYGRPSFKRVLLLDRRRLSPEKWRSDGTGGDGGSRHLARRVFRRKQRRVFSQSDRCDCRSSREDVRSAKRRLRERAQVSSSRSPRSAD